MIQFGSGYDGTDSIKTSTNDTELVVKPIGKSVYQLYKFSFKNYDPCVVLINGETRAFLDELDGFEMDHRDAPIFSFIIETANVKYTYRAGHR